MKSIESGLLVVELYDGGSISEWFEYSRERPDEVINLLKFMRKKYNGYLWREYKMYRKCRKITLSQTGTAKADYEGKFRKKLPQAFPNDARR